MKTVFAKRLMLLFSLAVFLLLNACGGSVSKPSQTPVAPPEVAGENAAHPLIGKVEGLERTLLARYYRVNEFTHDGEVKREANYRGIKYQPRQSAYAGYEGWDVLETPWSDYSKPDWLHLSLNRGARVTVVWDLDRSAGWLKGWEQGETTLNVNGKERTYATYSKSFPKGEVVLGGTGKDNGRYTVLLTEQEGVSTEPPLPAGIPEADRPQPNGICPSWLHSAYQATGPDGAQYRGWHPQIDPVYWCHFGHEHGSDPALVGYAAKFNYTAVQNGNQAEQHPGFKGFALRDEEQGLGWYFNVHATTGDIKRVCVSHHTVVIAVTDLKSGELLAELSYKGDFGGVVANRKDKRGEIPFINPTLCPEQAVAEADTRPVKRVRVAGEGSIENNDYERWFGGITKELGMDFKGAFGLELDVRNPGTSCNGFTCQGDVLNDSQGDRRTLRLKGFSLKYDPFKDADGDGIFYTNPYGTAPAEEGGEKAVRQYIKPGLDITSPDEFFATQDAWRALYTTEHKVPGVELEDGLGIN